MRIFNAPILVFSVLIAGLAQPQILVESHKLRAVSVSSNTLLGYSIDVKDGLVVLGGPGTDNSGLPGAAYLFASNGEQLHNLDPGTLLVGDRFGFAVATDGHKVVVGAPRHDTNQIDDGAVYVFDARFGTLLFILSIENLPQGAEFGSSVAVSNGLIAVGARHDNGERSNTGSVYLFDSDTGEYIAKIVSDDGSAGDGFGVSVAMAGGYIVVGAQFDDDNGTASGSAYIYSVTTLAQLHKLLPHDGDGEHNFGISVDTDGIHTVVGARFADKCGYRSGSAYLFDNTTGMELNQFIPLDCRSDVWFGHSVSIDSGLVLAGTIFDRHEPGISGAAYVFDVATGSQLRKLIASDSMPNDWLGYSVAISNGLAACGARGNDEASFNAGAGYLFEIWGPLCLPDTNHDGVLSPADFSAWVAAFNTQSPACDQNSDGSCTPADFSAWVANYNAGCP